MRRSHRLTLPSGICDFWEHGPFMCRAVFWPHHGINGAQFSTATSVESIVEARRVPIAIPKFCIWGANTGVGKTLVSAGLTKAARNAGRHVLYIKPVQTGFPNDSDAREVASAAGLPERNGSHAQHLERVRHDAAPGSCLSLATTLFAWADAVSPHLAVSREGRPAADADILRAIFNEIRQFSSSLHAAAPDAPSVAFVETAGGVCSPGPSGTLQCDLLRPLRLPAVLVCDGRLGSISACLSAIDSLQIRGYDIPAVAVLETHSGQSLHNAQAIRTALTSHLPGGSRVAAPLSTTAFCAAQFPLSSKASFQGARGSTKVFVLPPGDAYGSQGLMSWLHDAEKPLAEMLEHLMAYAEQKRDRDVSLAEAASRDVWWPFTQHGSVSPGSIMTVDSRWGDDLTVLENDSRGDREWGQVYDACCSWWTQGIGAGNQAAQARALAYAAGRFGHIIHPEVANEASVAAARALLDTINPPDRSQSRLTRVFWSDDGSTAIEVALKMAFRAFDRRRPLPGTSSDGRAPGSAKVEGAPQADLGLVPASEGAASVAPQRELHVVALSGGYHGDTLGAMDATEPSTFTDSQTPWYSPKGLFLAPPVVALRGGRWTAQLPGALAEAVGERLDRDLVFLTREAAFCPARRNSELARVYRSHIEDALDTHESRSGATVGALLMEPILQGAGGMRLVDPLFQWVLADVCRGRSIPVVADEVFTGLFRLGSATACAMLDVEADIMCFAKLLTAGTVPLAATVTTEEVFGHFSGDSKAQALLHGHSYSGHPIGCHIAIGSLATLAERNPNLVAGERGACARMSDGSHPSVRGGGGCVAGRDVCSCVASGHMQDIWDDKMAVEMSRMEGVDSVTVISTVLAVELRPKKRGGYGAEDATAVAKALRKDGIFSRPLGNVVYIMVSPTTVPEDARKMQQSLFRALKEAST